VQQFSNKDLLIVCFPTRVKLA